ncbi:MAG TPA: dihydrofolate reductase family protein [Nitrososphaerales archaeon]|nr:dihydrofolate reductase family protein [Nitrososphaerales archaeon]
MRRVIVSNHTSLDGYIAGPRGELGWFVREGFLTKTEYGEYAREFNSSIGGIMLGRKTYEDWVGYWPDATDNDPYITERTNNLPKYVFSTTLDKVGWGKWNNAYLVKGDAGEEVKRLKSQPGKDLAIFGSGTLVSSLTKLGLIDEYQITIQPVILGAGLSQFKDFGKWLRLKLVKSWQLREGAVVLYYQPMA